MKTLAIRIGYYDTTLIELENKGRNLNITKVSNLNCGKNFMIGRFNRIKEYADRLSYRIKDDFKSSMNDIILILPFDMCIDNLVDGVNIESKDKIKEIKKSIMSSRHIGLPGISITKLGSNTYNDMYLVTEYDSNRLNILLDALYSSGISLKQIVGPMYASQHLARTVTCPFEVINKGSNSSVTKSGTMIINISINRTTYVFIHNNLPIEIREGSRTMLGLIEKMSKQGVSFNKVARILRLIGVEGMCESELYSYNSEGPSDFGVLDSIEDADDVTADDTKDTEPDSQYNYIIEDDSTVDNTKKAKRDRKSIKQLNLEVIELDKEEDKDTYLSDEQYQIFEQALADEVVAIREEAQKNLNYFSTSHNVKIANVIISTDDIKGLGYKLEEFLDIGKGTLFLPLNGSIEIDSYTINNLTDQDIGCEHSLGLGAILSNFVRGDIYE